MYNLDLRCINLVNIEKIDKLIEDWNAMEEKFSSQIIKTGRVTCPRNSLRLQMIDDILDCMEYYSI